MDPALEKADGVIFKADSIRELAEKMGLPAGALQETVDTYNKNCAEGMDWDCFKPSEWLSPIAEGPFYGVKASLGTDGRLWWCGDRRRYAGQAAKGGVVEGLYAVGDLASRPVYQHGGHQEADPQRYVLCPVKRLPGRRACGGVCEIRKTMEILPPDEEKNFVRGFSCTFGKSLV